MTSAGDRQFDEAVEVLRSGVDLLRFGVTRFTAAGLHYGHGTDNALDEARVLLCHALHLPHDVPDALLQGRLLAEERRRVLALYARRVEERLPAPYLTGEAWFAGLPFHVDERVIVPRSPVAELIETGFAPWIEMPEQVESVLDLCTGSGCIAVACAYAFPNARIDAVDVSEGALEVARGNIARHGVGDRVTPVASNLMESLTGRRYQLIVCNPPYVDAADMAALAAEYGHEPTLALAAGEDGLDVVRRILATAAHHLTPDGLLVLELGNSAPAAQAAWPDLPFTWLEFERGGHGVCLLHACDLAHLAAAGES